MSKDTSLKKGTDVVDSIYERAYSGEVVIRSSLWNLTEAAVVFAVVFDKYEKRNSDIGAKKLMNRLLSEVRLLISLHTKAHTYSRGNAYRIY